MSTPELNTTASAALLLARWWARPLTQEIASWPSAADAETVFQAPVPECTSDDAGPMLTEYERLFVGPGHLPCPPYESVWRTDVAAYQRQSLMGPCVTDLYRLYAQLGIDPSDAELPDHVAVELEALSYALSLPDGGGEPVAASLLTDHLGVWLPRWCQSVVEQSRLPFYAQLAQLTQNWLARMTQDAPTG